MGKYYSNGIVIKMVSHKNGKEVVQRRRLTYSKTEIEAREVQRKEKRNSRGVFKINR